MNYPEHTKFLPSEQDRDTEQQDMLDNMFRNRKHPITVADTVGNPTADMSPVGAAIFNCLKSRDISQKLRELNQLRISTNPATNPEAFED